MHVNLCMDGPPRKHAWLVTLGSNSYGQSVTRRQHPSLSQFFKTHQPGKLACLQAGCLHARSQVLSQATLPGWWMSNVRRPEDA
jgi:hypothetical protein